MFYSLLASDNRYIVVSFRYFVVIALFFNALSPPLFHPLRPLHNLTKSSISSYRQVLDQVREVSSFFTYFLDSGSSRNDRKGNYAKVSPYHRERKFFIRRKGRLQCVGVFLHILLFFYCLYINLVFFCPVPEASLVDAEELCRP